MVHKLSDMGQFHEHYAEKKKPETTNNYDVTYIKFREDKSYL